MDLALILIAAAGFIFGFAFGIYVGVRMSRSAV